MASTSSNAPPPPLFAEGLFTSHIWKAVGLMPRQNGAPRSFSLLGQSSGGRTTTSSRGNGQEAAPMSEDRERAAGGHLPSTSSAAPPATGKRRRSTNNVNQTSPKGTGGKSVRGKVVASGCFLKQALKFSTQVPRRQRTLSRRRPASLSAFMKHLPFESSLSPKTSGASDDGTMPNNEAIAVFSPSRSSSPRDHCIKDLPVKKLDQMSSEEEETAVANLSSGSSALGVCSTPQTIVDVPMSCIF